jgi:ABC-2 type transport system ATP-binding protein
MSEMALTATELVVVGRGRLVSEGTVAELTSARRGSVVVRTDEAPRLALLLAGEGRTVRAGETGLLTVTGVDARAIGRVAAEHGIALTELTPKAATLEEAFMEITRADVDFHAAPAGAS